MKLYHFLTLNFCRAIKKMWQQVKKTNPNKANVIIATLMEVSSFKDRFMIGTKGHSKLVES